MPVVDAKGRRITLTSSSPYRGIRHATHHMTRERMEGSELYQRAQPLSHRHLTMMQIMANIFHL
jgi:hypothetical protein